MMQVTAQDYYARQIQTVQDRLDAERRKLKHKDKLDPKARKQLHKRISDLYHELKDLKYRAAYQNPYYIA